MMMRNAAMTVLRRPTAAAAPATKAKQVVLPTAPRTSPPVVRKEFTPPPAAPTFSVSPVTTQPPPAGLAQTIPAPTAPMAPATPAPQVSVSPVTMAGSKRWGARMSAPEAVLAPTASAAPTSAPVASPDASPTVGGGGSNMLPLALAAGGFFIGGPIGAVAGFAAGTAVGKKKAGAVSGFGDAWAMPSFGPADSIIVSPAAPDLIAKPIAIAPAAPASSVPALLARPAWQQSKGPSAKVIMLGLGAVVLAMFGPGLISTIGRK